MQTVILVFSICTFVYILPVDAEQHAVSVEDDDLLNILSMTPEGEKIYGFVGVPFRYKLNTERFHAYFRSKERIDLQLLTADGKELFGNTWININWLQYEIYGFPLSGNHGVSTYYIKATSQTGVQKLELCRVYITEIQDDYLHEIKLCTTLSFQAYTKSLDTRYALVEAVAKYLTGTDSGSVHIKRYKDGCIHFSFIDVIDTSSICNEDKLRSVKEKMFSGNNVNDDFRKALTGIAGIKSANLSLSGDCAPRVDTEEEKDLEWVKTAAPILILGGIIFIPVGISCYVCRGVRKRQNAMRQGQDKKLKEEQEKINEQIREYKRECGIEDSETSVEDDTLNPPPTWNQSQSEEEKKTFFGDLIEQYVPDGLKSKLAVGKDIIDQSARKRKQQVRKNSVPNFKNPISKMLEIKTPASANNDSTFNNGFFADQVDPSKYNIQGSPGRKSLSSCKSMLTSDTSVTRTSGRTFQHFPVPYVDLGKRASFHELCRDRSSNLLNSTEGPYRSITNNAENIAGETNACNGSLSHHQSDECYSNRKSSVQEAFSTFVRKISVGEPPQEPINCGTERKRKQSVFETILSFASMQLPTISLQPPPPDDYDDNVDVNNNPAFIKKQDPHANMNTDQLESTNLSEQCQTIDRPRTENRTSRASDIEKDSNIIDQIGEMYHNPLDENLGDSDFDEVCYWRQNSTTTSPLSSDHTLAAVTGKNNLQLFSVSRDPSPAVPFLQDHIAEQQYTGDSFDIYRNELSYPSACNFSKPALMVPGRARTDLHRDEDSFCFTEPLDDSHYVMKSDNVSERNRNQLPDTINWHDQALYHSFGSAMGQSDGAPVHNEYVHENNDHRRLRRSHTYGPTTQHDRERCYQTSKYPTQQQLPHRTPIHENYSKLHIHEQPVSFDIQPYHPSNGRSFDRNCNSTVQQSHPLTKSYSHPVVLRENDCQYDQNRSLELSSDNCSYPQNEQLSAEYKRGVFRRQSIKQVSFNNGDSQSSIHDNPSRQSHPFLHFRRFHSDSTGSSSSARHHDVQSFDSTASSDINCYMEFGSEYEVSTETVERDRNSSTKRSINYAKEFLSAVTSRRQQANSISDNDSSRWRKVILQNKGQQKNTLLSKIKIFEKSRLRQNEVYATPQSPIKMNGLYPSQHMHFPYNEPEKSSSRIYSISPVEAFAV